MQTYTLVPIHWDDLPEAAKYHISPYSWGRIMGKTPKHLQNIPIFCTDDDQSFMLTAFAGGASPGGLYSEVTCEHRAADGKVRVMRYRLIDDGADTPRPVDELKLGERASKDQETQWRFESLESRIRNLEEKRERQKRDNRRAAIMAFLDHMGF